MSNQNIEDFHSWRMLVLSVERSNEGELRVREIRDILNSLEVLIGTFFQGIEMCLLGSSGSGCM